MTTLEAAREYVKQGYSVIPVRPNEKIPAIEWKTYQTRLPTDEELVLWFGNGQAHNISVVTGAVSGITVIDLDGDEGAATVRKFKRFLPNTHVHKSPHGYHNFYQYNKELPTKRIGPGLDCKNDGGVIVMPPSVVDGKPYTDVRNDAPVALPDVAGLLAALEAEQPAKPKQDAKADAPMWVAEYLANGATKGNRNETAAKLAGYFHSRNVAEDIIVTTLTPFAERCQPPMVLDELRATVRSVCRYKQEIAHLKLTSEPLFREQGETLLYTFEQAQVTISVDNLRQDGDGLTGELIITTTLPGFAQHVHGPKRFNFVSTSATNTLAGYLKKRIDLDWPHLLEQVALLVTNRYRTGEPVLDLSTYVPPVQARWCLYPLVLEGEVNLLYGDGGSGKSTIALACLAAIQTGIEYMGFKATVKHVGLYLDWESTPREHQDRFKAMSIETELPHLYYRHMVGNIGTQVHALRKVIADVGAGFVVIDSAGMACGGDPNEAKDALTVFDAARRLGVTVLVIHHANKTGGQFGSVYWRNYARNMWEVQKQQDEGETKLHIGLYHRKGNVSRLERPMGFCVDYSDGQIVFRPERVTDNVQLAKSASLLMQVRAVLAHGEMTADQIGEEIGKPGKEVSVILGRYPKHFIGRGGRPQTWGLLAMPND